MLQVLQASNVWLRVAHQNRGRGAGRSGTGGSHRSRDTISAREASKKISRCRICALYTQSLWPRDREVMGEDVSSSGGFWWGITMRFHTVVGLNSWSSMSYVYDYPDCFEHYRILSANLITFTALITLLVLHIGLYQVGLN